MKVKIAFLCSLAAALPTMASALPQANENPTDPHGAVGMCIRWDGPLHLADAVVVTGTGNPNFEQALTDYIRSIQWPRPENYHGEWVGIAFGVGGAPVNIETPSCKDMPGAASHADRSGTRIP